VIFSSPSVPNIFSAVTESTRSVTLGNTIPISAFITLPIHRGKPASYEFAAIKLTDELSVWTFEFSVPMVNTVLKVPFIVSNIAQKQNSLFVVSAFEMTNKFLTAIWPSYNPFAMR
jgi:hypothetical protein